ncbi:hypothetical protein BZA05DRAFT_415413 [Tricharina praecox]|uniref:uncharacterized protein n=1 Tax=Tricharina praecox TaxID=43433 RepID=UPI0022201654|nr:uncharacterized protein BZA05DRAFT_415413 [Tricharina praecox]KAI5858050.1 hypothetical protein BZA05DRAFT_415413 [Tricharina praecox]
MSQKLGDIYQSVYLSMYLPLYYYRYNYRYYRYYRITKCVRSMDVNPSVRLAGDVAIYHTRWSYLHYRWRLGARCEIYQALRVPDKAASIPAATLDTVLYGTLRVCVVQKNNPTGRCIRRPQASNLRNVVVVSSSAEFRLPSRVEKSSRYLVYGGGGGGCESVVGRVAIDPYRGQYDSGKVDGREHGRRVQYFGGVGVGVAVAVADPCVFSATRRSKPRFENRPSEDVLFRKYDGGRRRWGGHWKVHRDGKCRIREIMPVPKDPSAVAGPASTEPIED